MLNKTIKINQVTIAQADLLESIMNGLSVIENPQSDTRIVKIG